MSFDRDEILKSIRDVDDDDDDDEADEPYVCRGTVIEVVAVTAASIVSASTMLKSCFIASPSLECTSLFFKY